ncbi:hypothetical protein PWT90_06204 [Aphanocladium album]|nr:hypothetical protein PWT90_06204 [Aphanocladium album]
MPFPFPSLSRKRGLRTRPAEIQLAPPPQVIVHKFHQRELQAIEEQSTNSLIFRNQARKVERLMEENSPEWRKKAEQFLIHHFIENKASQSILTKDRTTDVQNGLYQIIYNLNDYQRTGPMKFAFQCFSSNKSDELLWSAVITMIDSITQQSQLAGGCSVPRLTSHRFPEGTGRSTLEDSIFVELKDHVYRRVPGFMDRHFNKDHLDENMMVAMLKDYSYSEMKWPKFPDVPTENAVFEFLSDLLDKCSDSAPNMLHHTTSTKDFKDHKSQVDLFFRPKSADGSNTYSDMLVVGEHKQTFWADKFKSVFGQVSRYVRFVYSDQPLRAFVHAFTIQGSMLELFVYDRAGAYSSGVIPIHRKPEIFVRALVGYATMTGKDMGYLDVFQKNENGDSFIELQSVENQSEVLHVSVIKQIFHQNAISCRGTTCFSTPLGVLKLSWCPDDRESELDYLLKARSKGITGVATTLAFKKLSSIRTQRAGLEFTGKQQHRFRDLFDESPQWSPQLSPVSPGKRGPGTRSTFLESPSPKRRSFPNKSPRSGMVQQDEATGPDSPTTKAKGKEMGEAVTLKLLPTGYKPRALTAILITPLGKPIGEYATAEELLRAMKDATLGHRSLFEGGILHCDISTNNIIITDPSKNGNFHGMLIDLDMARDATDERRGKCDGPTGTIQFISYDVLTGEKHNFADDLESFLYVLLWLCSQNAWEKKDICGDDKKPRANFARRWTHGTLNDIACEKALVMSDRERFQEILERFPTSLNSLKAVCSEIRHVVRKSHTRTPQEVYDSIDRAYERGIASLE